MVEKRSKDDMSFTASEFQYILDVNKKAVEIYVEVEKQNDLIIDTLETFKELDNEVKEKLDTIKAFEVDLTHANAREHTAIIDMLKTMNNNVIELTGRVEELSENDNRMKTQLEMLNKHIEVEVKNKIGEMEKNIFRLNVILGSTGIGAAFAVLQVLLGHK